MLTVDEALRSVLAHARTLSPRREPLAGALGCILAEEVCADLDSPPFAKALVDGYAIRSADLGSGHARLLVVEEIPAGRTPARTLGRGEAALIMTGAPLPEGADTVVMIERTRRDGTDVLIDEPSITPSPGRNVLPRAGEMKAGELVLSRGCTLNAPRLGLLASVGRTSTLVVPRPRVAVVSTGDELVEPDQVPGPGQIRNSNASLQSALAVSVGAGVETLPIAPDQPSALRTILARGLACDVVVITGGVSAGNRDLVPETLKYLEVSRVFHKVRLKPGKPIWFGVGPARGEEPSALVFGLPGNPVSGLVGFLLFVRPALNRLAGRSPVPQGLLRGKLSRPFDHKGDRPTYHPSRWSGGEEPTVEPLDWAGSADLLTVARADGFALFPAGDRLHEQGEFVQFLPLG
jgi:molybdopterin molybdotransferase